MKTDWAAGSVAIIEGDITLVRADALVTAANEGLWGGGGVDGAIHRAGGPTILAECRRIGGCPTGGAVVTGAGELPARWVIHAVGPIWTGGQEGEADALASAYRTSLARLTEHGGRSIAFPSISTGVYGYPVDAAAPIALRAILDYLEETGAPVAVTMVLYDAQTAAAYRRALQAAVDARGHSSGS